MAQEAVEAVLRAFQHGRDAARQQQQFEEDKELRKQQEEDLRNYRQSELAHQQAQLDAQVAQTKAQQAANEKLFNLQMLPVTQQISEQYGRTGALPAGASVTPDFVQNVPLPQVQGGPLSQIPQGQQPPSFQTGTINLPFGLGTIQGAQSPEAYAQRQRILNAPAEEAKTREEEARQAAETARQLQVQAQTHQDYLEILGRQEKFQNDQRLLNEKFQTGQLNLKNNLQLQLMGLKTGQAGVWGSTVTTGDDGEMKIIPNDPTQRIQQAVDMVRDGTLSIEQAKKLYNTKQFPVIADAVSRAGLVFPTDKQIQKLTEIEPVAGLVDKLFQIHKLRLDHPFALQFPMSDATSQFNTLKDQIGGSVGGAAKFLNNIPRFSNVEKEQVTKALIPSTDVISHTGSEEFKKYETFTKDVQDAFNTILNTVPENQRNIIRQRMGLNNFPYLGSAIRTPGAATPAIGGANPPGVNIPSTAGQPKPGQIYVRKKSTGQEGWLDPGDFNPSRYEKAKPPGVK